MDEENAAKPVGEVEPGSERDGTRHLQGKSGGCWTTSGTPGQDVARRGSFSQITALLTDNAWEQTVRSISRRASDHGRGACRPSSMEEDVSTRGARLGAPQLQAQLSLLTEEDQQTKGAWQQVVRVEDLCDTHVSHKWSFHLDACAGSVLAPHDFAAHVQRRLGKRSYTGDCGCRLCGTFLDPQHGGSNAARL